MNEDETQFFIEKWTDPKTGEIEYSETEYLIDPRTGEIEEF